jgi:hypothetical protein
MAKTLQNKNSSSSLSVRSIGTGEIERVSTAESCSPMASKSDQNSSEAENEECPLFVVRNFQALTSNFLHWNVPTSSSSTETTATDTKEAIVAEDDAIAVRTDSNSSLSEGEIVFDLTTDLAYHNSSEREGADLVHRALTPEEQSAMPDVFMPLRHYRAEKVRLMESCL